MTNSAPKYKPCPICHNIRLLGWYGDKFELCFGCYSSGLLLIYLCQEHDTLYTLCGCKTKKEIEKDD